MTTTFEPRRQDRHPEMPSDRISQITAAVKTWSGQLIDLSGQNRLLFYQDLKVGTLDLASANASALDALLTGQSVALSQLFEPDVVGDDVFNERARRSRAIRNKASEALEERGIVTCFLAVGMGTWTNTTGTATPQAPIILLELSISPVGAAQDDFTLAVTGEPEINPTLLHLLTDQFGVTVPEDLIDLLDPAGFEPSDLFEALTKEAGTVPGFRIEPRYVVGTFSYAKLPMVLDLQANLDALLAHDVVAAIAGNKEARLAIAGAGDEVRLSAPDVSPPKDEFLVLDADSSQSYVVNAVVNRQSLVVAGPPGTGKSQTIANLIATLVARGQSVLFVAEKRAAITAVLDRLDRVGLGSLALDLHSGAGSRRAFAESLAAGLRAAGNVPLPDHSELHAKLASDRDKLNAHATAMHAVREPWGISVFEAQVRLLGLRDSYGPAAETATRLAALSGDVFRATAEALHELASLGGITLTRDDSLWAGAHVVSSQQAEAALDSATRLDVHTAPEARRMLDQVVTQTGLHAPRTLAEWAAALSLLDGVAGVLGEYRVELFTAALPHMVAATASGTWRKANPTWPAATAGWGYRRTLAKQAKALRIGPKLSRSALHASLMNAHQIALAWAAASRDGGVPRLPASLTEVHGRFDQLTRELAALGAYLSDTEFASLPAEHLQPTLHSLASDERTLRKMPRINELASQLQRAGLSPLLEELRYRRADPTLAVAIYEACWYRSILDRAGFDDQVIANFSGPLQDEHVAAFRENDKQHIVTTVERVRRAAAEKLIRVRDEQEEQSLLVQGQASRKRGHLPLRQLFGAAPDVMTALKPCWAMSPLMVSQLLPGDKAYFDVVIFDESSQIVPSDAIPAIVRGKRVVVAGDRHQLPPTSFFAAAAEDNETDALNEDGTINLALTSGYESILDVMTAALGDGRTRSLTWHYRSKDERLIAFSNVWIYDNSLTTFPGAASNDCLAHVLVDQPGAAGQEDSVTAEVERVVALVLHHAQTRPDETLGVITMGIKHANRIEALLRERLRGRRDLEMFFDESADEKFFVKNLERVQGDERDAIILTIGYGKTPDGRLPYRFGPLLLEGGHRRLNVAITRARSRMTVVSSFSHLDMDPNRSNAGGVKMLRAYLQYAASGGENLGDVAMDKPALNPFEISVRDRLVAAGIPLTAQYGVAGYWIDFAAAHPTQHGRMVLAIEADGATYHSSDTARDRDRLRQEQLERLGWTFHRIWSTDWFHDSDTCVAAVRAAYERAVAAADAADGQPTQPKVQPPQWPAPAVPVTTRRTPSRCPVAGGRTIVEYTLPELISVIAWIESDTLLRTEEELYDEFRHALGFQRRGSRIQAAFDRALETHGRCRR